jgi:hypothetical protein
MQMNRQVELYEKIAADYDRMALAVSDQALQVMYTEFAQQWRDAAANRVQNVPTAPADDENRVAEETST